jgi:hypothetical protein
MMSGLREVVLSGMLRGTYSGAVLACIAFWWIQEDSFGGIGQADWPWDQHWHYVFEGALIIGLANGIRRLLAPASFWEFLDAGQAVAPVGWLSRIGRWLSPWNQSQITMAFGGGVLFARIIQLKVASGRASWLEWVMLLNLCMLCLALLLWLVGVTARRLRPSSSLRHLEQLGALAVIVAPLICPVVGYLLGMAVALLPGARAWSLAPLYGLLLGVAGSVVLAAAIPVSVKPCDETGRAEEKGSTPL